MWSPQTIAQRCYVARNLKSAVDYFVDFHGVGPFFVTEMPPGSVKYTFRGKEVEQVAKNKVAFGYKGGVQFEICETDNPLFAHVIDGKDMAHHHFLQMSGTFGADLERYRDAGFETLATAELSGGLTYFIDTWHAIGHYTELVDFTQIAKYSRSMGTADLFSIFDLMCDAAVDWDGSDRIRPFPS